LNGIIRTIREPNDTRTCSNGFSFSPKANAPAKRSTGEPVNLFSGGGNMKVNKIDHICIAVKDLDEARKVWEPVLGKSKPDDAYIDEPEKIKVARYWVGEVGFELMESTTPDGDVAKFIEKRGEGVMLISFNVDNTREAMADLKQKDYPFIGGARPFRDCEFAFVHPKKMNGVLLELIDYKWKELEER
jgi:methylmalonyl-CoA/ethylmalonyl-CoA epimerase